MGEYSARLKALHRRLRVAQIAIMRQQRSACVVIEGFDAAGKGGVIRELSYAFDPRGCVVHPIGPPTTEEAAFPFLWRFWQRLPAPGQAAVFDRSWYGRLLVESVEYGLSDAHYAESVDAIAEFEAQLSRARIQLVKLFLRVSETTQRSRLKRRANHPEKRWKLTVSDLDSLQYRADYDRAVQRMLTLPTDTSWQVIDTDDKKTGRIAALVAIAEALERDLAPRAFSFNPGVEARLKELS
jgi:polyphosphate kinase 2 (PPK2 family)